MGRVWDVCGYEPDLPDCDESDRYDRSDRSCNPTHGEPCGECSACEDDDCADDDGEGGERWFHHENDGSTCLHATADQARAAAEADLEWCRVHSGDGWPEETGRIFWGEVRGIATHRVVHAHDETCRDEYGQLDCLDSAWDETWEYDLRPPVDALKLEDARAMIAALVETFGPGVLP